MGVLLGLNMPRSLFFLACTASILSAVASVGQPIGQTGYSRSAIQLANLKSKASTVHPFSEDTAKLYLFNGTNEVPGSNELLEYDVKAKTYTTIARNNLGQNDCLSASVVCGGTYYAVWTMFPAAAGVLAIDLKTGKSNYLGTGGQSYIYHTIGCNPNDSSSLIGFASQMPTSSHKALQFQLVHLDIASGNTTMIGSLPPVTFGGYDGTFRISPDGTELYAAFPGKGELQGKATTGDLYIMDIASGKVKEHHKVPAAQGYPYAVFPSGSETFHGTFLDPKTHDVSLCTVTKKGSGGGLFPAKLELSSCKVINNLFAGSVPMPVCGNTLYSVADNIGQGPGSPQALTAVDISSGEATQLVDLSTVIPGNFIGTVACA